ncbi:hypothetical protein ABK040_000345 [Willaertia magna]
MPKASTSKKEETSSSLASIKPASKIKIRKFPAKPAFECTSGELLWGQVQHLIKGHSSAQHDSKNGPVDTSTGGTIIQNTFRYKAAARKGNWVVEKFIQADEGFEAGFIIHHEDISAKDLLDRCKKAGMSSAQDIVYVNRYDWSWHTGSNEDVKDALKPYQDKKKKKKKDDDDEDDEDDEEDEGYLGGRLQVVDDSQYDCLMKLLASGKHPKAGENVQYKTPGGNTFGVHISGDDTEYELGWLIFSGKKHSDFTEDDELVGIVYDSTYCALEEGEFVVQE